ncbi:MAG: hypothetical protein GXX10_08480 [Clostridiaceae bacterium]|nr:hypothetical protein [Clostridiaceae bacterium]
MFFISINKRSVGYIVAVIFLCLMVLYVYSSAKIAENENKYQSILCLARMFDEATFIAYLGDISAQTDKYNIEVFDIEKGEVIIKKSISPDMQNEAYNYVSNVKSLYTRVIPFPEKGYVIRIPFNPPRNVNVELLNNQGIKSLDSIFIILSDREAPVLLVLDSKLRPFFYTFSASIQPLLDYLDLKPNAPSNSE